MQAPISPLYSTEPSFDDAVTQAGSRRRGAPKIDYSKFKTKMCRNYVLGLPCPFQDRCAFSHGEEEVVTTYATPSYADSEDSLRASAMPPPPSYEDAVADMGYTVSQNSGDYVHPRRYRNDPYGTTGFTYEY